MKTKKSYLIICEGDSEYAYVQEVNRLLNERGSSVVLLPCNAHGGSFVSLRQVCRNKKTRRNGRTFVLADRDIYERNHDGARDLYEAEKDLLPPFLFQYWNFEDFLLMHCPESVLEAWREVAARCGHSKCPLCSDEFAIVYQAFCEEHAAELGFDLPYEKGDMPFPLKVENLANLRTNSVGEFPRSDFAKFVLQLFDREQLVEGLKRNEE